MKIRRYKKLNKTLGFYINNFGFRQPYQLLIDGTFCFAALNNKVNIADNIPKYLQGEVKLITTQCAIMEMEKLGPKLNGALIVLKQYVVHKCGHEGKPVPGSTCLKSMLGKCNDSHYILCTQDRELQEIARHIPAVPLLYLHVKTPVLEKASEASVKRANDKMSGLGKWEIEALQKLKGESENKDFKKKKKKQPNPLSCKKKKQKLDNPLHKKESKPEEDKRKRKRVRIPKHVTEELMKNKNICE